MNDVSGLPRAEFAFPGALRDQLVAAILAGEKTSTTDVLASYEHENEPLPQPGERHAVIDSSGRPVAVIETTDVQVLPLADVGWEHVRDEGEGYVSVADWRERHERFWHSSRMRSSLGDPDFTVGDGTLVVTERFRVVKRLRPA
ncbi:ASCH domain-containing protein [Streptomyces sp. 3N207]|uniref:ASCH domain-containing protein n=1 Tax=Streptomyces sp. 3N207 TaxID=3457417 RepID=UPI003FD0868C